MLDSASISVQEPLGTLFLELYLIPPQKRESLSFMCGAVCTCWCLKVFLSLCCDVTVVPQSQNWRRRHPQSLASFCCVSVHLCSWPAVNTGRFTWIGFTHFIHRICAIFIKNVVSTVHPHLWKCPAVLPLRGYFTSWHLRQHVTILPHSHSPSETNCSADHLFSP